jgi:hypothetical protein
MPGVLLLRSNLPGLAAHRHHTGERSRAAAGVQRDGLRQPIEATSAACCGAYQPAAASV